MSNNVDASTTMFWSSEVEEGHLSLEWLGLKNVGHYQVPVPVAEISALVDKARSGHLKAYQNGTETATFSLDASLVKIGRNESETKNLHKSVCTLACTALTNAANVDFDSLVVNKKINFKKAIICLPGGGYKSTEKFAAVESGFAGTILLQVPIRKGYEDAHLCIVNQTEVTEKLDLSKNSSTNAYFTLLLNQAMALPLHFEITPPSSGAVIFLVYHLVWVDSFKLSAAHSTLPAFFKFTRQLISSIEKAESAVDSKPSPFFYIQLPGATTLETLDSNSQKGDISDTIFGLASLKRYDIVIVSVDTKTSNSVVIRTIVNSGNSQLIPEGWIGSTLQVVHITLEESQEVFMESSEEFGALLVPRKNLLFKSCSNNFSRVVKIIEQRFQSLKEQKNFRGHFEYDLKIIADYVAEKRYCPENQSEIADVGSLLDKFVMTELFDACAAILKSIQSEVISKLQDDASFANKSDTLKLIAELVFIYSSRIDRLDITKPIQLLIESNQEINVYQLILDTLCAYTVSLNKDKASYSVEDINIMLESLLGIGVPSKATKDPKIVKELNHFFLQFPSKALVTELINFKAKYMLTHNVYPDLYEELLEHVIGQLSPKVYCQELKFLDKLMLHYAKSTDVAAFARVFTRTTFSKKTKDSRCKIFLDFLMSTVNSWASIKTFHGAFQSSPNGSRVLQDLFAKFLSRFNGEDSHQRGKIQGKKKNPPPRNVAKPTLPEDELPRLIRFFALGIYCRDALKLPLVITRCCQDILDLVPDNQLGTFFSGLFTFDSINLKETDSPLSFITGVIHTLVMRFPNRALEIRESEVWMNFGDCLAWNGDIALSESIVTEVISKLYIKQKRETLRAASVNILKGILQSSVAFGNQTLQKPVIKEKLIDEMLDIWITIMAPKCANASLSSRKSFMSCLGAFFRARKLNLYMPRTLPRVHELHAVAKTFDLDNFATMFEDVIKMEVDPVRPVCKAVDSISWRLYVAMCTGAITSPLLEDYLKTCELEKVGHLYGFALWVGNKLLLDTFNEKISRLPSTDSKNGLREALADWPNMKRLAVDASSKEALKQLIAKSAEDSHKYRDDEKEAHLEERESSEKPWLVDRESTYSLNVEKQVARVKTEVPDTVTCLHDEPPMKKIKTEPTF